VDYDELIASNLNGTLPPQPSLKNSDLATIQFTSGTTSTPKAACLSHRNVLNNAFLVGRGMQLTEQDIICCPPPLYHCFGLVLGLLSAMSYGKPQIHLMIQDLTLQVLVLCFRLKRSMPERSYIQ